MRGLAFVLTEIFTATPQQRMALTSGVLAPLTPTQVDIFTALVWVCLAILSLGGFLWLGAIWRSAPEQTEPRPHSSAAYQ